MAGLWNVAKEAARVAKGLMSKNARNAAEAEAKKERGPVKTFFHITKNENVTDIEKEGLRANSANANTNSAIRPFAKLGVKGGGVWVTDKPTAFPVYGTTIGGKNGNGSARADALTTFKIELPVGELKKLPAVYNPYGRDMRLTDASHKLAPFGTWAGEDVGVTALLKDIPPEKIKNIGYVEEQNTIPGGPTMGELADKDFWKILDPSVYGRMRELSKPDRMALSRTTGHDRYAAALDIEPHEQRSPARFVEDYFNKNQPIDRRLPKLPNNIYGYVGMSQFPIRRVNELNESGSVRNLDHYTTQLKRQSPTAEDWTNVFKPYTKPGEAPKQITFQPGAYSRGMGTIPIENIRIDAGDEIKRRHFDWKRFNENIEDGELPWLAAQDARPRYVLDWDNIEYSPTTGYHPRKLPAPEMSSGAISNGPSWGHVGTGEGNPWTLYDVYKIRHDPNLTAADRMNYRDDLIRHIYDDGVATGIIDDISPKATWNEIMKAMMKIQTSVK